MRLSCLQENLSRALGIVSKALPGKATKLVTNNILLVTENQKLRLVATNLKLTITCWIDAQVVEEGSISIPGKMLTDFIGSLPNDRVDINLKLGTKSVNLQCGSSKANINGMQEFPPVPTIGDGSIAKIKVEDLREGINRVVFAAATEDTRIVLTGIYFLAEGTNLTLVGADGFRLAEYKAVLQQKFNDKIEIIIPSTALAEVGRLFADKEGIVDMQFNSNQVLFKVKNLEILSQTILGNFPDYKKLIPISHLTKTVVKVPDFLKAVRTAAAFTHGNSDVVKLYITEKNIKICSFVSEIGDHETNVEAVTTGEDIKIAINTKYLVEVLGCLRDQKVAFELSNHNAAVVLRPESNNNHIIIVMPMCVQW